MKSVLLFLLLVILSVATDAKKQQGLRSRAHVHDDGDESDQDVTMVGASKSLSQKLAACQIVQPPVRF